VVRIVSDHPVRAFLTFNGASTPPPEEGNRSLKPRLRPCLSLGLPIQVFPLFTLSSFTERRYSSRMPIVSVTRLRLRSFRFLPQFLWMNNSVNRQIVKARGFLRGRLLVEKGFTFWTATAWVDEASMRAFRDSGAHKRAMPRLPNWCCEATSLHWTQDNDQLPDWNRAFDRAVKNGRVIYVKSPSDRQKDKRFPPPRSTSKIQQELRPR
jgi:hypothetical protein